jgi:phosphoribosylglycinamide formyltransferase
MDGKTTKTGVMIHYVISEVDMGQPILVEEIPFIKGEDEDLHVLEQKIHSVEWKAIVKGTNTAVDEYWKDKGESDVPQ